jgi:hypothetical protein
VPTSKPRTGWLRGRNLTGMDALPVWDQGTPAILCVAGPHPIPVSTAVRAGDDRVLFALGRKRDTLQLLRDDSRAAFCLLGEGVAFTAHGNAWVVAEQLDASDRVVAVELRVERLQDHLADGRTEMLDGPRWRWRDEEFGEAEEQIVAELSGL